MVFIANLPYCQQFRITTCRIAGSVGQIRPLEKEKSACLIAVLPAIRQFMNDRFGWHNNKAASNWRDHGVTFDQAAKAIADPFAMEWIDDREAYGEERINLLGMCEGVLLHVTYTERGDLIWIISARQAERHEQDDYYRTNSI
jgi:uncharacterized DUF497 family protein